MSTYFQVFESPVLVSDEHVRVSDSLPFFGETVDKILPRRTVSKETLPAFRGFTHLDGSYPSDSFVRLMRQVAEIDRDKSQQDAMDRSGIESFKSNEDRTQESVVIRRKSGSLIAAYRAYLVGRF